MSLANLEALIMELMILGMAANSIKSMVAFSQGIGCLSWRLRSFRPKCSPECSRRSRRQRERPRGRASLSGHQLLQMVALDGSMSPLERRAVLVLIGTACVSRVDEVAQMRMCDLL
jgi:hypothetical protein